MRFLSKVSAIFLSLAAPASAQEAVQFGDWRAYCAPTAGCALGTSGAQGDRLAFSEPFNGEDLMLLVLSDPIQRGTTMTVTLDGYPGATLGPGDGWRAISTSNGPAIQLAPSIAENEFMPRMLRRNRFEIRYVTESGTERRISLSLNGYADARGYVIGR